YARLHIVFVEWYRINVVFKVVTQAKIQCEIRAHLPGVLPIKTEAMAELSIVRFAESLLIDSRQVYVESLNCADRRIQNIGYAVRTTGHAGRSTKADGSAARINRERAAVGRKEGDQGHSRSSRNQTDQRQLRGEIDSPAKEG